MQSKKTSSKDGLVYKDYINAIYLLYGYKKKPSTLILGRRNLKTKKNKEVREKIKI